jgi:hypothetical integral membrane protein (TIGR02206 family)
MQDGEFVRFGQAHLATLVAPLILAAGLALLTRRRPASGPAIRWILALVLLGVEVGWFFALHFHYRVGWKWALPLQLCDAAILLTVVLIFTLHQRVLDVVYYWGLTGVPLAMLMPDVPDPFPDPYTIVFFFLHGLVVAVLFYLLWSGTMRPSPNSMLRSFVSLNVLMLVNLGVNTLLGTNYMYLMQKPAQASLLDHFGPWPVYILVSEGVALALFWLLSWPYRKHPGQQAASSPPPVRT